MNDDLEKLKKAMNEATPEASDTAREQAINVAMENFEKNFQGLEDEARPTQEQSQWWVLISEGVKDMAKRFTTREVLLTTASVATVAVAAFVIYPFNSLPVDQHGPIVIGEDGSVSGVAALPETVSEEPQDDVGIAAIVEQEEPAAGFVVADTVNNEIIVSDNQVSDEAVAKSSADASQVALGEDEVGSVVGFGGTTQQQGVALSAGTITLESEASIPMAPALVPSNEMMPRLQPGVIMSEPAPIANGFGGFTDPSFLAIEDSAEAFPEAEVNPVKSVSTEPVSTFSIDVDTASYAFVRNALMAGQLPPVDAVRTEELINYFSYDYPVPNKDDAPFSTSVSVMDTPWNADTKLLHIGIKGFELPIEERPPVNLVFLIDTSGSMDSADKLPLLINSFRLMLSNLQPDDKVAIVTYAGSAGVVLEPTSASESAKIMQSFGRLHAGGSTAGQAGLQQAYDLAEQMSSEGESTSRVILATDGDFNVGISDPDDLKTYIEDKRDTGVYLSVLGFGRGNYDDATMQALAQNGNGTAAYIDTLAEAQKVLVDQIGGALFTIAQDVKIQIEFNPAQIAEYRLIGYETRALNREDFNNDKVDAGDIGAGHTVTAIYEITPVGSPAILNDPLRYSETEEVEADPSAEYAFLKLRYKEPGETKSNLITTPILPDTNANLGDDAEFAVAVAGFGQLLRKDQRMQDWTIADAIKLAEENRGTDQFGYRSEFLTLMKLAKSLSAK